MTVDPQPLDSGQSRLASAGDSRPTWRKSSYSGANGDCVEIAMTPEGVGVRDSEDPSGPVLSFTHRQWECFLAGVRAGEFDPPSNAR
ncbi:hypothetical protein GCM10023258_34190 [Terrabacter aeriphilus]|uniref:DUF397 domain-containing protein n=1 Tax=Terrabacter aeriphilus TaxID=515662 RepID=A0ABP9JJV0_9MICO